MCYYLGMALLPQEQFDLADELAGRALHLRPPGREHPFETRGFQGNGPGDLRDSHIKWAHHQLVQRFSCCEPILAGGQI